jgi:glycosyltransferase involved in cell wall biosynthesis
MKLSRQPRITVTIPTYNRSSLLREAMESVLSQSVSDIELFISDNASSDNTAEVVGSFNDPRVNYIRNDKNIGHYANMSRGLQLGTAPFVAILPDDDIMLPKSLERKLQPLEKNSRVGIAHSASKLFHVGPDGNVLHSQVYLTGGKDSAVEASNLVMRRMLSDSYWIHFPSALIRRAIVGNVRFDPSDGMGDDLGMFLRLLRNVDLVAYIAEPLTAIRMHSRAHSSENAFHKYHENGFLPTFVAIANIRDARNRFLDRYGNEVEGVNEIRASSRRWIQGMLMQIALWNLGPSQSRRMNWNLLRQAAEVDPGIILTPDGARFLSRAILGPRAGILARRINRIILNK